MASHPISPKPEAFPYQQTVRTFPAYTGFSKIEEVEDRQVSVNTETILKDEELSTHSKSRLGSATIVPAMSNTESPITSYAGSLKKYPDSETDGSRHGTRFAKMSMEGLESAEISNVVGMDQSYKIEVIQEDEEAKEHAKPPVMMPAKLKKQFDKALMAISEHPIEYYESMLYDITRYFSRELSGVMPKLESIEQFHPLFKLQMKEHEMSALDKETLMMSIEELIENHAFAQMDYKLLKMVTEFYSGMLVKWNLIREYEYSYRHREAVFSSKLIDISEINRDLISMEVLYFASVVCKPPLDSVMHQTVKQYSVLVLSSALKLLDCLLQLTDADFNKVFSISGYLSARNPQLALKYKMIPDYSASEPSYHKLSLKTGCLALCMSTKKEKQNLALKEMLTEFEMAYRFFETVLIKDLSHLKSEV